MVPIIARAINIPFTVAAGINSVKDVSVLLENGADKISINTAAVKQPALIIDSVKRFGSQRIVVAFDTKFENDPWLVYVNILPPVGLNISVAEKEYKMFE